MELVLIFIFLIIKLDEICSFFFLNIRLQKRVYMDVYGCTCDVYACV